MCWQILLLSRSNSASNGTCPKDMYFWLSSVWAQEPSLEVRICASWPAHETGQSKASRNTGGKIPKSQSWCKSAHWCKPIPCRKHGCSFWHLASSYRARRDSITKWMLSRASGLHMQVTGSISDSSSTEISNYIGMVCFRNKWWSKSDLAVTTLTLQLPFVFHGFPPTKKSLIKSTTWPGNIFR